MTFRTITGASFQPGDRARFAFAQDIEVYIVSVTLTDDGQLGYHVVWWQDGRREEASGLAERELEGVA
jgi:hypothetical protein